MPLTTLLIAVLCHTTLILLSYYFPVSEHLTSYWVCVLHVNIVPFILPTLFLRSNPPLIPAWLL